MISIPFLQKNDLIGITAPSAGIDEGSVPGLEMSIDHFRENGFRVRETANVRTGGCVSGDGKERARQLGALYADPEVKLILSAAGGDFLIDMLPYVDYEQIAANPKWLQGYSDPTNLLYSVTTLCDMPTIYGTNAGGFDMKTLHPSLQSCIDLWQGNVREQNSYALYESGKGDSENGYALNTPVYWQTPNGAVDVKGRMLGGCMDCLCDLIGTPYDGTLPFLEKYRDDGVIWYFDIFAMRAEAVHNTLWNMREAGWFQNARAFVFGRVLIGGSLLNMSYTDAVRRILGDRVPLICEADIGHVAPRMTVINGAMTHLCAKDGKGKMSVLADSL